VGLNWSQQFVFGVVDKVAGFFGSTEPGRWLTIGSHSNPVRLYGVDGKSYVADLELPKGWRRSSTSTGWQWASDPAKGMTGRIRRHGQGTLSTGQTHTDVTLTEVTDFAVKHRVVIAYAAETSKTLFAFGEARHTEPTSILVAFGLARDDSPEGLAAAVPYLAVFEVTPSPVALRVSRTMSRY
jgi:hypothetical protein